MALDFDQYFKRYEALVEHVDKIFDQVAQDAGEMVTCQKGCSDCCHALFDLSLVEALYLNQKFTERLSGMDRNNVMERADDADRKLAKFKRHLAKASRGGTSATDILAQVAGQRMRCPLLGDDDLCVMYDVRPITCRLYGVPTAIGGQAHTCHKSGFAPGKAYQTVAIDKIHEALLNISRDLTDGINSRFSGLGEMLFPASMALMNDFDEAYLGVKGKDDEDDAPKPAFEPAPAAATIPTMDEARQSEACASCNEDKSACASCAENSFSITLGGHTRDGDE